MEVFIFLCAKNNAKLERGALRLVINYKLLNKILQWIRYPIPNKRDLKEFLTLSFTQILSK